MLLHAIYTVCCHVHIQHAYPWLLMKLWFDHEYVQAGQQTKEHLTHLAQKVMKTSSHLEMIHIVRVQ